MVKLDKDTFTVIRHVNCSILVKLPSDLCQFCVEFRHNLGVIRQRIGDKQKSSIVCSDSSTANVRYLSRPELEERYANVQVEKQKALRKVARLSAIIKDIIAEESKSKCKYVKSCNTMS